ncbi:hypothetical protein PYW08_006865 [Mythimna loreyi]|uniref:Uncharacterized protein n=1 Tax=Mythimna loreyi TaxID=667449 RepID=A0ACC2RAR7_9NEOP|nr:hypothetical protein PYW08_006865 [Mythimna loreyi]
MNYCAVILCVIIVFLQNTLGLEYNKHQWANTNTDFLLHEGGASTGGNKRVTTQPSGSQSQTYGTQNGANSNNNYAAQFPALGPPSTSQSQTPTSNNVNNGHRGNVQSPNGKRDYVAPQYPTLKPIQQNQPNGGNSPMQTSPNNQNGGYAAQFPSLGPPSPSRTQSTVNPAPQNNPQPSNGKRDYIAPQYTTVKPIQQNSQPAGGKVKDLINFYDGKGPSQGTFSYSSVLQGNSNKNGPSSTGTLPSTPSVNTPKPMTFSTAVWGNKPSTTMFTTPKPTTRYPTTSMTRPGTPSRPGTPVLPSSIVNNNPGSTNTNTVTDAEIETLSEELLRKDTNNAARYITINYQAKTTSRSPVDLAPLPLITVTPEVWNISTIQKFVPLLDNYERDTLINEHVTPQERAEENAFMDAIMSTTVIRHLMTFLKNKGYVTPDPKQQRDFLKQLWFGLYSRGKGKISSSGFEHVFVSELKNGDVSGLHNWIYFSREEAANRINYLGYLKYEELGDKGAVLKLHFNQQGVDKPVNSIFIGTSPELEMALYTLCFVTRADNDCKLKLANKDVSITAYTFRYRSKNLIGSAFPQI